MGGPWETDTKADTASEVAGKPLKRCRFPETPGRDVSQGGQAVDTVGSGGAQGGLCRAGENGQ